MTTDRAYYASLPCYGVVYHISYPLGGSGIATEMPCSDTKRCVPCELRRQDAQHNSPEYQRFLAAMQRDNSGQVGKE